MKKIALLAALMIAVSTTAFAAPDITMDLSSKSATGKTLYGDDADADADSPLIGKTSTGVGLSMITDVQGYALSTQHMNGSKAFASSYDSTSIYSEDVASTGTPLLDEISSSDTSDFSGWSPL